MSYSRDFEGVVKFGPDVLVDATSIDQATGKPGTKDPATEFYVALVKSAGGAASDTSEPVGPGVSASWTARFPGAAEHYEEGDSVYVIGVANIAGAPPEVWQETHTIGSRTAPDDGD